LLQCSKALLNWVNRLLLGLLLLLLLQLLLQHQSRVWRCGLLLLQLVVLLGACMVTNHACVGVQHL
jgi:hypothetical protein